MILASEVLMGRDKEYPPTPAMMNNLTKLLIALNLFRTEYGKPMNVTSGYRPGHYNTDAHGAKGSCHLSLEACDFADPTGDLKKWALLNLPVLEKAGLWMESPASTNGWIHLQTRQVVNRVFQP